MTEIFSSTQTFNNYSLMRDPEQKHPDVPAFLTLQFYEIIIAHYCLVPGYWNLELCPLGVVQMKENKENLWEWGRTGKSFHHRINYKTFPINSSVFFFRFGEKVGTIRTEKDKADWNDINNFSQQFEGIFKIKAFIIVKKRKELTGWQPELSLRNKFLSRSLLVSSPSGPGRCSKAFHQLVQPRAGPVIFPKCHFH